MLRPAERVTTRAGGLPSIKTNSPKRPALPCDMAVLRAVAIVGWNADGTEPTADSISAELDSAFLGHDIGEIANAILGEST